MSGTKRLPHIDLKNLRPPYPSYRNLFLNDESGKELTVRNFKSGMA